MNIHEVDSDIDVVRRCLAKFRNFSDQEIELFYSHLKPASITKHEYLLKEGKVCQSIYLVRKGSFRQYLISNEGEDITLNLFVEDDWMLDYKSFTSQERSTSFIQATEESKVFELNVYSLHELMKHSDIFFHLGRIFQYAIEQHDLLTHIASPVDRYYTLLTTKPTLVQRFPLKFIASYLGMAPETLSRVRNKISH